MREGGLDGFSEREFPRDWDPIPYPQATIAQMHHPRHIGTGKQSHGNKAGGLRTDKVPR